jgi:hypothetical protein
MNLIINQLIIIEMLKYLTGVAAAAISSDDPLVVPLTQSVSGYFMGEFKFGSTLTPANLTIDTGSSELVVTSELCSNCPSRAYIPGKSKTTKDTGLEFVLDYSYERLEVKVIMY